MVTVEIAIGFLSATILAVVLMWTIALVITQARCTDASAQVARAIARGDEQAANTVAARAPGKVEVSKQGSIVRVRVLAAASILWLPSVQVSGEATVPMEPGVR